MFLREILLRMKDLNLNQNALAKRMKCSRAYVSKVLQGEEVNFSFATALRFARALRMDFAPHLRLTENDDPEPAANSIKRSQSVTRKLKKVAML